MSETIQSNDAVWRNDQTVSAWVARTGERERGRVLARQMMAELLPFESEDSFTFVDLGAGTGAASRVVLEHFPNARGVLADYSAQMIEEGRKQLMAPDQFVSKADPEPSAGEH